VRNAALMSRLSWVCLGLLGLVACGGAPAPGSAKSPNGAAAPLESKVLKGSRLSMWLPDGMYRGTRLLALRLDEPLVVVALAEFTGADEAAAEQLLAGMREGAELPQAEETTRGGARGFIGAAPGINGMTKQILGLKAGKAGALVVVQYQPSGEDIAKHILDSVRVDERAEMDPLLLAGITLGDRAGLEVATTMSQPIILSEKGARPPLSSTALRFALMTAPYPKADVSDEELGQMLGGAIADLKPDTSRAKGSEFQLDGRPAFYLIAPGEADGKPVAIYGFVARGKDSALVGFGHVGVASADKDLPRLERLVQSLKLDDGILGPR
jgi:hypothetical protein